MSKRQRRQILSEEEYTNTLSTIIQRDYFPDLPLLERDAALHTLRHSGGDPERVVAVRRAARQLAEHEESLEEQEVIEEEEAATIGVRKTPRPLHRETVTGFHARVTSEDNDEFEKTQEKDLKRHRSEFLAIMQQPAVKDDSGDLSGPRLASDSFNPPLTGTMNQLPSAELRNSFFFPPALEQQRLKNDSEVLLIENSKNPSLEKHQDAALMPPPPSIPQNQLVEFTPKARVEKKIDPTATRFPERQIVARPSSSSHWDNDDYSSVNTSSSDLSSADTTDLDESSVDTMSLQSARRQGRKRALREDQTFVRMTPLLRPGRHDSSPLTTWGTVGATPLLLSGQSDNNGNGPEFRLPEESTRERNAALAEAKLEARAKKHRQASKSMRRRPPSTPLLMTPATSSLLQKSHRPLSSSRSRDSFGTALRQSYSATPVSSRLKRSGGRDATPQTMTPVASKSRNA